MRLRKFPHSPPLGDGPRRQAMLVEIARRERRRATIFSTDEGKRKAEDLARSLTKQVCPDCSRHNMFTIIFHNRMDWRVRCQCGSAYDIAYSFDGRIWFAERVPRVF